MTDKYTIDTEEFEEDEIPSWKLKEIQNAKELESNINNPQRCTYSVGDVINGFEIINRKRSKDVKRWLKQVRFRCTKCSKEFSRNISTVKNLKKCKFCKE
ncbi:MAG: hypothetical protein P8Y22_06140 [Sulfurimonas sp.]